MKNTISGLFALLFLLSASLKIDVLQQQNLELETQIAQIKEKLGIQ